MNSNYEQGERGANIIPSARRSIHNYKDLNMARYGLKNASNREQKAVSPATEGQGIDVVDNVQSKMSRQASPLQIRKAYNRSHSYSQDDDDSTDDNSDGIELEGHHYSNISKSRSILEDSYHSQGQLTNNESSDRLQSSFNQGQSSFSTPRRTENQKESNKSFFTIFLAFILAIVAIMYLKYPIFENQTASPTINYDEIFKNNMKILQEKYNIDNDSILKLKIGISTIFSKMDAGSFMFIYNSNSNNFNSSEFDKFINEIAYIAAKYLRYDFPSIQHTVLSSKLDMEEHAELINRYRDEVDKTGVLLVKEVDRVPSDLAMAFHYYCDEYDPVVKRSAIFFTLDLASCNTFDEKKPTHAFVEKCLSGKWKTVPPENIRPLLTRVVDSIIDMTSGFKQY